MSYDNLAHDIDSKCMHRHIRLLTTGSMHFDAGEVWDDITDQFICMDCLKTLSEAEIRATWTGKSMSFPNPGSR